MQELTKKEMLDINGGTSVTSSMINAVYKIVSIIYEVGESLGSYIRRRVEGRMCDI